MAAFGQKRPFGQTQKTPHQAGSFVASYDYQSVEIGIIAVIVATIMMSFSRLRCSLVRSRDEASGPQVFKIN